MQIKDGVDRDVKLGFIQSRPDIVIFFFLIPLTPY